MWKYVSAILFLEKIKNIGGLAMARQKELQVNELVKIDTTIIDGTQYDVEVYEPSTPIEEKVEKDGKEYCWVSCDLSTSWKRIRK